MRLHTIKWVAAAGLALAAFKAYQARPELSTWLGRHQFHIDGLDQALPSQVYFLDTNRWLQFDIPNDTPLIRLISNASLAPDPLAPAGTQWPYAIEYQLLSRYGRTIDTGVYHFKGEQLLFVDKFSGKRVEVNSYLDRRFSPLAGRRCILNLSDPTKTNAQTLRVRLHSAHPDLLEVAIRAYFKRRMPERKLAYRWNRLSDDQKRDLTRGNVYSVEGLSTREQQDLLRYYWTVAAPEGIPGRDFQRRIIHIRDDSETLALLRDWEPFGIAMDAEHCAVLPVTNAPGSSELRMVDDASTSEVRTVSSALFWHSNLRYGRETNLLTWSRTNLTVLPANQDGLLEVTASRPVHVRTFHVDADGAQETTPEPANLVTFQVSPTQAVEFAISHAGWNATLFRIDLRRCPCPSPTSVPAAGVACYELLEANNGIFQAGEIALTNVLSPYDWLVTTTGLTNISMPQSLCFQLPPEVRALRISSPAETIFVNAYSRPSQLTKRVEIPADYSPANRLAPEQPSWFTVHPPDYAERYESGQTSRVRLQASLPEYDPLIQAGQYEWESFLPEPLPAGHMVLLPTDPGQPIRPENVPFSYIPVATGCDQPVCFRGVSWETEVTPSLVLVCTNGSPGSVTIRLDGRVSLNQRLDTPVTALRLGNLPVGNHTLHVAASSDLLAFLNCLGSGTNAPYLQRFCAKASSNILQFPYVKRQSGEEVLALRVFSPMDAGARPFRVRLKLKPGIERGLGPFPALTFLDHDAVVIPNTSSRTFLIAAAQPRLDDGQLVLFRVGPDVPPGRHEFVVAVEAESPRWLSLSRTTPGLAEKLEITSKQRVF